MIQALGKIVWLKQKRSLSKHDFSLPLSDILLDLVEKDLESPSAVVFSQLACSFAHDFVNLATLAGQLLWYVAVSPVRTGTPDSIPISLAAESYLVFLRSACDVIATIFVKICIDIKKQGQLPKGKQGKYPQEFEGSFISFRDLIGWAKDNPTRLPDNLRFLPEHWDWFMDLRGIRDKVLHKGYDINVFTDHIAPSFALISTGELELHFLHKPRQRLESGGVEERPLLPLLKGLTEHVLRLADQVANVIGQQRNLAPSQTHILNGVYLPALNHILSYEEPIDRELAPEEEARRKIKAWYLFEAGDYLGALNFGYPDGFWLKCVTHLSELFAIPPSYVSKPKFPPYRDSERLIFWQVIFTVENKDLVFWLRDAICLEAEGGPTKLNDEVDNLKLRFDNTTAALVLNSDFNSKQFPNLIADSDPIRAAHRAFNLLTGSS
jgi:hypothetical protein